MALRLRRGTDAERLLITPVEGELVYTTDTKLLYVGDGTTAGGTLVTGAGGGGSTTLDALTDTDLTGAANSDVLTFNASTNKWEAVAVPGVGILDLNSINGIAISGEVQYNQVLAWDGVNFSPRYTDELIPAGIDLNINILGGDSSIIVDTDTNTFTGSFVGDGSLLTNLPISGGGDPTSLNSLTDVAITEIPAFNQILAWDGVNFSPRYADEVMASGIDLNINIVGDDSTIIVNTDTNTVTGNFVGDLTGNVTGTLDGDIVGSVFADDSTLLVDGVNGLFTGDVLNSSIQTDYATLAVVEIGPKYPFGNKAGIRITTDGSGSDDYDLFTIFSYHDDAVNPSISSVLRGRGTPDIPAAIQDNDPIYAQVFAGRDSNGDGFPAVLVKVSTEGTTGAGIIPGVYEILVTDSAGTLTPAFKVDSEQNATVTGTSIANIMQCAVLTSAPGTPAEGMIAVADGNAAGWDPKGTDGGTSYPCYYDGSAWNALF